MNFEWFDFVRLGSIVFAMLTVYKLVGAAVRKWSQYEPRLKRLFFLLNGLLLLLVEGTMEQIILDIPWGPRTLFGFIISLSAYLLVRHDGPLVKIKKELPGANRNS